MSHVILQLFKRNPFSSMERSKCNSACKLEKQVHQMHKYRILSYFDGMCIQQYDKAEDVISDKPCMKCVSDCEYKEMSIHAERKKLILLSDEDAPSSLTEEKNLIEIEDAPFIALVNVCMLYNSKCISEKDKIERIREAIVTTSHLKMMANDIAFYQLFRSFSGDDIYIMLYADSWNTCEKIVSGILQHLNPYDPDTKEKNTPDLYQTYTILGYDRVLEDLDKQEKYKDALDQFYTINLQMQTIPGITPEEAAIEIRKVIKNKVDIHSIVGHYDLDVFADIQMRDFVHLVENNKIFGWYSNVSIGTETSIDFSISDKQAIYSEDRISKAANRYFEYMDEQREWLKQQKEISKKLRDRCTQCGMPKELMDNLFSLYRFICQRLVRPQIWGAYYDVRKMIQRYFYLLDKEIERGITSSRQKTEIVDSMKCMIDEISALAKDRLYVDYPSFEHVVNNVYEKGAYEDLIQALRKWMQLLEEYAWNITQNKIDNIKPNREDETNNLFHVEFSLVPILYGQTVSNLLFPSAEHAKRLVVVKVSSGEMVKIDEILPSLAHEVGHYAGICYRDKRIQLLLSCSTLMLLFSCAYHQGKMSKSGLYKEIFSASADAAACLLEKMTDSINKIGENETLEVAGGEIHDLIMNGIDQCEGDRAWMNYLMVFSRSGFVTKMSIEMKDWLDNKCDTIIDYLIQFIREITADVFMIISTGISFENYLEILYQQLDAYYITVDPEQDEDDKWIAMYARIICIENMYYSDIDTIQDACEIIRNDSRLCKTYLGKKIIEIVSSMNKSITVYKQNKDVKDRDNPGTQQNNLYILDVLFECYKAYIRYYIDWIKKAHEEANAYAVMMRERIQEIYRAAIQGGDIFYISTKIKEDDYEAF